MLTRLVLFPILSDAAPSPFRRRHLVPLFSIHKHLATRAPRSCTTQFCPDRLPASCTITAPAADRIASRQSRSEALLVSPSSTPGSSSNAFPWASGAASTPNERKSPAAVGVPIKRGRSDPGSAGAVGGESKVAAAVAALPNLASPRKVAQFGSDLAWRTILSSVVEVDGVGELGVARVLQEVWKRGGDGSVALAHHHHRSFPPHGPPFSRHAHLHSLRASLDGAAGPVQPHPPVLGARHLLGLSRFLCPRPPNHHSSPSQPLSASGAGLDTVLASVSSIYGPPTPTKELDLSQWMNVTPGADWSFLGSTGNGTATRFTLNPSVLTSGPGPSSLAFEIGGEVDREQRRSSTSRTDEGDSTQRIDDLIAAMEEGREAHERRLVAQAQAAMSSMPPPPDTGIAITGQIKATESALHLPTPEIDTSESPSIGGACSHSVDAGSSSIQSRNDSFQLTPPESEILAFTPTTINASSFTSIPTSSQVAQTKSTHEGPRAKPAMQLALPPAPLNTPPPMCMFFSPSFRDLQKGKVGVWKGDLEIKGRGGGKFSVLIVGEEAMGYLCQSHTWPSTITYPPTPTPTESYTATMIPVSHLAREGFTPAAMGMVLCDDANISQYVSMVQGLHAEGVAFHLPIAAKLPVVILPAKFDSADPLQRLGIAVMTEPGFPLPPRPPANPFPDLSRSTAAAGKAGETSPESSEPRKKNRRQSAPSKGSAPIGGTSTSVSASGSGRRRTGSMMPSIGGRGAKVYEEVRWRRMN
ncbi:hypothetical protein EHS25_005549 [Saitozyma podzolica]|uniref:Uncharacterized protein n=1 Tax=Saitozyma podzolica TaxID=1890683 RepID=A0A427XY58_9TREE|nr:hypothetical protein EHS25_005549 [Saitozyma podzolica]